jgi:hypothetical protein
MEHGRITRGFYFEDLPLGTTWLSQGRTITESDLGAYVNLTWFTEDLFTDQHNRTGNAIGGRPVPALMVMAFSEGLVLHSMDRTGLAFAGGAGGGAGGGAASAAAGSVASSGVGTFSSAPPWSGCSTTTPET